jgi:hypothetical protein
MISVSVDFLCHCCLLSFVVENAAPSRTTLASDCAMSALRTTGVDIAPSARTATTDIQSHFVAELDGLK